MTATNQFYTIGFQIYVRDLQKSPKTHLGDDISFSEGIGTYSDCISGRVAKKHVK